MAEAAVFTLSIGLGSAALVIFFLGIVGFFHKEVFLVLTIAGALATVVCWLRSRLGKRFVSLQRWRNYLSLRGAVFLVLSVSALGYWGLLLLSTQYPPMHWDAISHHLVLCREYLAHHRLVAVIGIPHPVLPALNHMLFTWSLGIQDDILAQMIEHTFLMLTAVGLYAWGRREGRPLLGVAAGAFWLASPLVMWLGESAYIDVCLVCFVYLGVYALRVFWDSGDPRWWYLVMALLGMAAGVKLSGLFFVIIGSGLGLLMLLRSRISRRPGGREMAGDDSAGLGLTVPRFTSRALVQGWALAALCLVPWYAFIFYHTGNPIWPTFPEWSRGEWGARAVVENTNSWLKNSAEPRTLVNFLMLPIDWITYPGRFYAETNLSLFPMIVAWPLAWVFAIWDRSVRWWTLWALAFTFYWFLFPHQLRYWLPALPLAGLALYESIRWMIEKLSRSALLHTMVWTVLALSAIAYGARSVQKEIKVKGRPPVNAEEREAYVSMMGAYSGVRYVNSQASPDDVVCVINGSYLNYYLKPQVLDVFGLLQSGRLPKFRWPEDAQWIQWLESRNVSWIFVNHANAPAYLVMPKQNLVLNPIWPDYALVYADRATWVFRHKPVPAEVW